MDYYTIDSAFSDKEFTEKVFPFLDVKVFNIIRDHIFLEVSLPGAILWTTRVFNQDEMSRLRSGVQLGKRYMELKEHNKNEVLNRVYSESLKRTANFN